MCIGLFSAPTFSAKYQYIKTLDKWHFVPSFGSKLETVICSVEVVGELINDNSAKTRTQLL